MASIYIPNNKKEQYVELVPNNFSGSHLHKNEWNSITELKWIDKKFTDKTIEEDYYLKINEEISLKIPIGLKDLESVFLNCKYILELKENWDDEGAKPYTNETWKAAVYFVINFNKWLRNLYKGSFHNPKIHHGPNGTIDLSWNEDNIRLFINIDYNNNIGSFYSDNPAKQYSEGQFSLDNFKFHLLPIPFKY